MNDNPDRPRAEAQEAHPQPPAPVQEEPIGGEIRVRGGGSPRWLRWLIYLFHVWAVGYLVVHPKIERHEIVLVFAGLIAAWFLFFALTKRPPEL